MRRTHRTFREVTAELDRRRFISMGFERIEALLSALGNPERDLRVVQVVGTNGKGTTSVTLSAAMESAGRSTGTYLSPHVMSYAERVRLRGEQVSEDDFADGMGHAISVADDLGIEVTQFEILTAGALAMFRDAGVEWAIMEAGLGARYDATTASLPEAVVLTNVAMDHMQYLGDTISEIASEKLASVPRGGTLILGTEAPVVLAEAETVATERGASLLVHAPPDDASYQEVDISLGMFAAESLLGHEFPAAQTEVVRDRIRGVLPGRMTVRNLGGVDVVMDGGHNVAGIRAALSAVSRAYPGSPVGVVFGVLGDKDIQGMLDEVSRVASVLVLTSCSGDRAADPDVILRDRAPVDSSGSPAVVEKDTGGAITKVADEMKGVGGVVLVTGSLNTTAAALRWFGEGVRVED